MLVPINPKHNQLEFRDQKAFAPLAPAPLYFANVDFIHLLSCIRAMRELLSHEQKIVHVAFRIGVCQAQTFNAHDVPSLFAKTIFMGMGALHRHRGQKHLRSYLRFEFED